MRSIMFRGLAGLLLLALAASVHAIDFEYRVKPGDQWKQKVTITGEGQMEFGGMKIPMTMEIVSTTAQKVTAVEKDGNFTSTIETKNDSMTVTANGMQVPVPTPPGGNKPVTVSMTKLGKPVKIEGLDLAKGGQFDFSKMMSVTQGMFPSKSVNVGDTWDASPDAKELPMKITGKLLSVKKVDGKDMGELEYVFEMSGDAFGKMMKQGFGGLDVKVEGKGMTGKMATFVDVATGIPGSGKGSMEMDFTMNIQGNQMRQQMKMNVVSEAIK